MFDIDKLCGVFFSYVLANEISSGVQHLVSVNLYERTKGLKFSISTLYAFYALNPIVTVE